MHTKPFLTAAATAWLLASSTIALSAEMPIPARPATIPDHTFVLKDFGAVPDGHTPNTAAFRAAIAAVSKAGGGTLVVQAGDYFTGPIDLCSNLNLHLDAGAHILFSQDRGDYDLGSGKFRPQIQAMNCHDITISGSGAFDGQGQPCWVEERKVKNDARAHGKHDAEIGRPNMLVLNRCQRVLLTGITLTNSPKFHFVPAECEDVTADGIKILAPADSPNTDGIDPSVCQRVLITHCRIDTGDDCIAVKSGMRNAGPVRDVLVTDCTFLHGHGCSIGSETNRGVQNMIVRNCTFEGTDWGVRLKSERSRGGTVENVTYTDLTMNHVGQAIVITSYYYDQPQPGQHDTVRPITEKTPIWRNLTIRNIKATACTKDAGVIMGLPEMPVSDVTLENVSIDAPLGLRIGYAKNINLHQVRITPAKGRPLILEDTAHDVKPTD